jgi:hypothetical protein
MYLYVWEFNNEYILLIEIDRGRGFRRGSATCHDDSKALKDVFTRLEYDKVQLTPYRRFVILELIKVWTSNHFNCLPGLSTLGTPNSYNVNQSVDL